MTLTPDEPNQVQTAAGAGVPRSRIPLLVALLTILALAFWLQLYRLSDVSLRGDEAFSVTFARQDLGEVWRGLLLTEPHPPLYYTMLHCWMAAAGQSELSVRFVSGFFGLLTVAVTYRLARSLSAEERVAQVAALLVALNPYLVWQSQDARMYTLLAATCAASFLLASLVWRAQLAVGRAPRRLWLGYMVVTLLSLYSHYGAIFALLAQNLALLVWLAPQARRHVGFWLSPPVRKWLLGQVALAAGYLPWILAAAPLMLGHTKGWIAPVTLAALLERSLTTYSVGTTAGDLAVPLAAGFALVLAAGAWRGLRIAASAVTAVLVYLLAPLLAAFVVSLARPMFDERYLLFVIPAYSIALAWIAARPAHNAGSPVPSRDPRAALGLAAVALVCVASLYSLGNYFTQPQYAKSPGWRELVQYIVRSAEPGDVVVQNYPDPSLSYYMDGRVRLEVIPSSGPLQTEPTISQLVKVVATSRLIWFLPYDSPGWDETGYVQTWLGQHSPKLSDLNIGGMPLQTYQGSQPVGGGR
ncbi:MAG: glycosyltransferase family 39 protein [Chloroflexota bacterium]|nr:glycosyltransferase family 39 protein [Chloroflexota bacterium]